MQTGVQSLAKRTQVCRYNHITRDFKTQATISLIIIQEKRVNLCPVRLCPHKKDYVQSQRAMVVSKEIDSKMIQEKKSCQKSKKNSESTQWIIKYIFFYLADSGGMFYLVHLLHYVHKSTRYIKAQHIQLSVTHTVKLFTNHSSVMSTHTHPISEKDRHKQQKIIYFKGGGGMNVCLHTGSKAAVSSSRSSKTRWLTSARTSDNI